jgi:hypothetical protein
MPEPRHQPLTNATASRRRKARLGFKGFIGQQAGEHAAGAELMIGPPAFLRGIILGTDL